MRAALVTIGLLASLVGGVALERSWPAQRPDVPARAPQVIGVAPPGRDAHPPQVSRAPQNQRHALAVARGRSLAHVRDNAGLSAYGGWVVWNERRGPRDWRLQALHRGRVTELPVPSRPAPFDVDLGPDARGRPTAVYSRCSRLRCHIVALTLGQPQERRAPWPSLAGRSETHPALWRGAMTFVQRGDHRTPRLVLARAGHRGPRLIADATCSACTFEGIDLGPTHVAYVSRNPHGTDGVGPTWELVLMRRDGSQRHVLDEGFFSGTCGSAVPASPNVDGDAAVWLTWWNNCDDTNGGTHTEFRTGHTRRDTRSVEPPPVAFPTGEGYELARDAADGSLTWVYGTNQDVLGGYGGDGSADFCRRTSCQLLRDARLRFTATR